MREYPPRTLHRTMRNLQAMAGATTHAPTADRQEQRTPELVREWIWEANQVVSEIAAETDLVFDSICRGS